VDRACVREFLAQGRRQVAAVSPQDAFEYRRFQWRQSSFNRARDGGPRSRPPRFLARCISNYPDVVDSMHRDDERDALIGQCFALSTFAVVSWTAREINATAHHEMLPGKFAHVADRKHDECYFANKGSCGVAPGCSNVEDPGAHGLRFVDAWTLERYCFDDHVVLGKSGVGLVIRAPQRNRGYCLSDCNYTQRDDEGGTYSCGWRQHRRENAGKQESREDQAQ
jgi:hypothetical protein